MEHALPQPAFAQIDSFAPIQRTPTAMMRRPCPVCGAVHDHTVIQYDDMQFFSDSAEVGKRADVRQVRCGVCHTLFMNPCYSASGFGELFAEAGMTYGARELRKEEQLDWLRARDLLWADARYLDVGCYLGDFLAALPSTIDGVGVDIDPLIIARAQKERGGPRRRFFAADLTRLQFEDQVDVITMFHVLEHLPEPIAVLKRLRAAASPTTRMVVEVPLLELAKTNDINGYLTVSHLTHFSAGSLARAMAQAGWKIIDETWQQDYNGCRVLAEPAEEGPGPLPDPGDLARMQDLMAHWYQQLAAVETRLAALPDHGRAVLWGAGFHTELVYQLTSFFARAPKRPLMLVDSDPLKHDKSWRGVPILSPDVLPEVDWSEAVLLVSSYASQEAIVADALRRGVPEDRLVRLYDQIRRY